MKLTLFAVPILILFFSSWLFQPLTGIRDDVLRFTNIERENKRLKPLIYDEGLSQLAQEHSDNMASGKIPFSHQGFEDRSKKAKVLEPGASSFAENVSYGPASGQEVVKGWMNSKPHRSNILGAFTHIGIGISRDTHGRLYYTQFFSGE